MLLNIIMAATLYPCCLLIAFFIYKMSRFEKNLYFGAYMKREWYETSENRQELDAIKKAYKREFFLVNLLSLGVSIIFFFIPYESIQIFLWVLWLFAVIVVYIIPQARAFKKVRAWKKLKGYDQDEEETAAYAEMGEQKLISNIKSKDYLFPLLIACLTAISPIISYTQGRRVDPVALPIYITFLICVIIVVITMLFVTKYINRRMPRVISNNSVVNVNYKRAGDMIWSSVFKQMAWSSVVLLLVIAFAFWVDQSFAVITIVASIIYTLVIIIITVIGSRRQSRLDKKYADKFDFKINTDDDRNWIWGVLYYNPRDSRSFVNTRMGMGLEANMAKPMGKILTGVGIIAILVCLVICFKPIFMEFTPMSLQVEENKLVATHVGLVYEIDLDQVESVSLIKELPKMSRTVGTSMEEQLEGDFYVRSDQRKCKVMLNPKNEYFIRIEAGGVLYYLGDKDDADTQIIYNQISPN